MTRRQAAHQIARHRQLKAIAVGVDGEILEVSTVGRRTVGQLQRTVQAIAQRRVAECRNIDLVGAHVEVEDLVADARGTGAVTVEFRGIAEHIGTRAAGELVHPGATDQDVVARAAIKRVVTCATDQLLVGCGASEGVIVRGAIDHRGARGYVLHGEGEAVADGGVAGVGRGDLDGVSARRGVVGCATERASGGIECEPTGQGAAIGQLGGVAEAVVIRIGEAGGRDHVTERATFGRALIQQRRGQHRRLVGW
ncbi:hypothetical protein D3C71_1099760 [compost metagenome]